MKEAEQLQYLIFRAGSEYFGINISNVVEIIIPSKIDEISLKDGSLARLNYHGEELPINYANKVLFRKPVENSMGFRILIVENEGQKRALVVDSAEEIVHVSGEFLKDIKTEPPGLNPDVFRTVIEKDERIIHVVDGGSLFRLVSTINR